MTAAVWQSAIEESLRPLGSAVDAPAMQAYMKDVAPFLGVRTPARRRAVRQVVKTLPTPTPDLLSDLAARLWALPEREFQYAACDVLARFNAELPASFLASPTVSLLTSKPWWDSVDSLVTACVAPLTLRFPGQVRRMREWNASADRWLVRASIGHQRGRKADTDMALLTELCSPHASDREFFIAKAIGWAMRDVTPYFPRDVRAFLATHPELSSVARTEALRGLVRFCAD